MSELRGTFGASAYGGPGWSGRTRPHRAEIGAIWADCWAGADGGPCVWPAHASGAASPPIPLVDVLPAVVATRIPHSAGDGRFEGTHIRVQPLIVGAKTILTEPAIDLLDLEGCDVCLG